MYNHNKQGMRTPGGTNPVKYRNGRFDTERSDEPRSESPRLHPPCTQPDGATEYAEVEPEGGCKEVSAIALAKAGLIRFSTGAKCELFILSKVLTTLSKFISA